MDDRLPEGRISRAQANLPTQEAPPGARARFPGPHGDQGRAEGPAAPPRQRTNAADPVEICLSSSRIDPIGVAVVYDATPILCDCELTVRPGRHRSWLSERRQRRVRPFDSGLSPASASATPFGAIACADSFGRRSGISVRDCGEVGTWWSLRARGCSRPRPGRSSSRWKTF
jgi:hypothetical protein